MAKKLAMAFVVFVTVLLLSPLAIVFAQGISYEAVWTSMDWFWVPIVAAFVFSGFTFTAYRG